jgi:hypothetical protein
MNIRIDIDDDNKIYYKTFGDPSYFIIPFSGYIKFIIIKIDNENGIGICIKDDMDKFLLYKQYILEQIKRKNILDNLGI